MSSTGFELELSAGYGACIDDSDYVLLEDRLRKQLLRGSNGVLFVEHKQPDDTIKTYSLTDRYQEFCNRRAVLKGSDDIEFTLPVCFTIMPRASSHLFWNLFSLYEHFGLTVYKGTPSKWVYNGTLAWTRNLSEFNVKGWLLKGTCHLTPAEALTSLDHILPQPAAGTLGLLLCLDTWASRVPQLGGFRDSTAQANALKLGSSLIGVACHHPFSIAIKCSEHWKFSWPRPDVTCDHVVTLAVTRDGNVNLEALRDAADMNVGVLGRPRIEALVWGKLSHFVDTSCKISLSTLCFGSSRANLRSYPVFWLQIPAKIAVQAEASLLMSERKPAVTGPRLEMPEDDGDWTLRDVDKTCLRHTKASREATRGQKFFGLATDKANTRGFDVQNAFMTLPSNTAFELVPQVMDQYYECNK